MYTLVAPIPAAIIGLLAIVATWEPRRPGVHRVVTTPQPDRTDPVDAVDVVHLADRIVADRNPPDLRRTPALAWSHDPALGLPRHW